MRTRILLAACLAVSAEVRAQGMLTFSPNGDGVKDDVTFRLKLADEAKVSSWSFEIKDQQGALVKGFEGKGRPPESLVWDGKDLNKRLVPDAIYLYSLGLVTPAGNQVAIEAAKLLVDRVHPTAEAAVDPALFSPNGDGVKDETQFNLKSYDANGIFGWLLVIKDKEGAPVRNLTGKGAPPGALRWDGRGDFEEDAPDGDYTFALTVHDLAGNKIETPPQRVSINRAGQVSTVEVSPILFSPNGDGYRDEVTFNLISAGEASVERWELGILNRNGKPVHAFSGHGEPPRRIIWNGAGDNKKTLADGPYQVVLTETDRAGNRASTSPQPLEIDTTPPLVQALLEPDLLSPNGDGFRDEGVFQLKAEDASPMDSWRLSVYNDVGRAVRVIEGAPGSRPKERLPWRGENDAGEPLTDGVYAYELEAKDIGGNRGATARRSVRVDRAAPVVSIEAKVELFSPNGDGVLDTMELVLSVRDASPLESWRADILDAKGKVVRSFSGQPDSVPPSIVWDGKGDDRSLQPDGTYTYVLKAKDIVGNEAVTPPRKVTMGASKPEAAVSVDLRAISPNADGIADQATFSLSAKSFSRIEEWWLKIHPKSRQEGEGPARTFTGRGGVPGNVRWSGERDDKRPLPDGEYEFVLEIADQAGNRVGTAPQPVQVDTTRPMVKMEASPPLFSPNKDGEKDETLFLPDYRDGRPIARWSVVVRDPSKKTVWEASGEGRLPTSVPWKGVSPKGQVLPDGSYTYVFTAADDVGNEAGTPEQVLRIDTTPPEAILSADPALFSPNADGVKDETVLLLDAKDASDLARWSLTVTGSAGLARSFSGLGRPPRNLPWNGANDRGNTVPDGKYQAVLAATDEVGNTGKSPAAVLTVDTAKPLVVVEAETDTLEELIPQMSVTQTKQQDLVISLASEVLFDTGLSDIKSQAYQTLMKATHLIRRYPMRKVRIEGHADNVPIRTEQFPDNVALSRGRAKAVMKFFQERGQIPPERMSAEGYGDKRPKTSNETEEGRRQNRRVEIILLKEGS